MNNISTNNHGSLWARVILMLTAAIVIAMPVSAQAQTEQAPIVQTASGPVQGAVKNDVQEFLGIPYAAPPVEDLRWRPPAPPAAWTETRDATKFGKICAQSDAQLVFATPSTSEDCLYLNIFTTGGGDTAAKPVLVWIHGGGFYDGESNDYDGSALAAHGAVVVTINYRLGVFGWFAHPALDSEGHDFGNYGLMDQQAALAWIRKNIAAFGGDPDKVAIFGQSSGGQSVLYNVVSPASAGLFQRAIPESGPIWKIASLKSAEKKAQDFATAAGCPDQSAACLRALTVQQILARQKPFLTGAMVDGTILPIQPDRALATGRINHVQIFAGNVRNEGNFFTAADEAVSGHILSATAYPAAIAKYVSRHTLSAPETAAGGGKAPGTDPAKVAAEYPLGNYPSPSLAYAAIVTDLYACVIHKQDLELSKYVPVYTYEFDDQHAPSYFPPVSFPMQAYHSVELQFLFPLYHGATGSAHELSGPEQALSRRMIGYWTGFTANGSPAPQWPLLNTGDYMALHVQGVKPASSAAFSAAHKCDFWNKTLP